MAGESVVSKLKPYIAMVLLQFGYAGMYLISVSTLKRGMNHYVLVVYRNATAVVAIAPFAFYFERIVLDQNLYYMGAKLTSAGLAAAMVNILPAVTFLIALTLRMEKVTIKSRRSQAKIIGTLITVAGALLMILYKGPIVEFIWSRGHHHGATAVGRNDSDWLKGTLMLLASCICWSGFFVLQSNTLESYPAELSLATLICFVGVVMSTVLALVAERGDSRPWCIGFDTRLFAAVYSGIVCSGVAYYVQGMVMKERGPVFVTAFNPLCMMIVTVLGSIILAEEITLGRMLGALVIAIGLYFLIWGKSKDVRTPTSEGCEKKLLNLPITRNHDSEANSMGLTAVVEIPTVDNTQAFR